MIELRHTYTLLVLVFSLKKKEKYIFLYKFIFQALFQFFKCHNADINNAAVQLCVFFVFFFLSYYYYY